MKIKFDEYVRLHKIITGLSVKGVWEFYKGNGIKGDIKKIAEDAPDEFYKWLEDTAREIRLAFHDISSQASLDYADLLMEVGSTAPRKEQAEFIKKTKYPSVVFSMLDSRAWDQLVWKMIKPKAHQTFKVEI